jgi:hypothetical protein
MEKSRDLRPRRTSDRPRLLPSNIKPYSDVKHTIRAGIHDSILSRSCRGMITRRYQVERIQLPRTFLHHQRDGSSFIRFFRLPCGA